jgi:hypothetical protein
VAIACRMDVEVGSREGRDGVGSAVVGFSTPKDLRLVKLVGKPVEGCKVASGSLEELMPRIRNISGLRELKPGTLNIRLQHAYEERPDFTIPPCDEHPNENVSFQRCRVLGHGDVTAPFGRGSVLGELC